MFVANRETNGDPGVVRPVSSVRQVLKKFFYFGNNSNHSVSILTKHCLPRGTLAELRWTTTDRTNLPKRLNAISLSHFEADSFFISLSLSWRRTLIKKKIHFSARFLQSYRFGKKSFFPLTKFGNQTSFLTHCARNLSLAQRAAGHLCTSKTPNCARC